MKLSGDCEKTHSISNELLADIQDIFETKRVNFIRTTELITALCEDEENAWATYNRGEPITARQVNKQLSAYDISSTRLRPNGNDNPIRGFELSQFDEVFKRYLSDNDEGTPPKLSGTVAQDSANADVARFTAVPDTKSVPVQNDIIRHRNQLNNNPVPACAGTEKLSGTAHVIDNNKDSGICATVPDKNGVPGRTQLSKHDVGRI